MRVLAKRYGINQTAVAKWKHRTAVADLPTGPKGARSTVFSPEEEAVIVTFRRHTPLPLDDCLYALQATFPHLTRSSLHRGLRRHDSSRLSDVEGNKPSISRFKSDPIGYLHIDIAETRTEEGRLSAVTHSEPVPNVMPSWSPGCFPETLLGNRWSNAKF